MSWKNDQVTKEETDRIIDLAKVCLEVPGDYVELGCYRGDTSLLLAEVLKDSNKKLWIYDSFEGLPEKGLMDESVLGIDFKGGELFGLPVPVIKKGWFSELTDSDLPGEIAFAFLDGDFYESIKDSLKLVAPKMVEGGIIIVHDYTNQALPGVKKAVDEFRATNQIKMILM